MFLEGKRKCDIAREWGISQGRARELVENGRRASIPRRGWGRNMSPRLANVLNNIGVYGSDSKTLDAYLSGLLNVSKQGGTRNYGEKTKAELETYLIDRGLMGKQDVKHAPKKPNQWRFNPITGEPIA